MKVAMLVHRWLRPLLLPPFQGPGYVPFWLSSIDQEKKSLHVSRARDLLTTSEFSWNKLFPKKRRFWSKDVSRPRCSVCFYCNESARYLLTAWYVPVIFCELDLSEFQLRFSGSDSEIIPCVIDFLSLLTRDFALSCPPCEWVGSGNLRMKPAPRTI